MNGKLGDESLGEFKLGDAILEAIPTPAAGGGKNIPRGIPRRIEEADEDAAIAFVLTQV